MILATRIQHHPSRAHLIPPLLEKLAELDDVDVVTDRSADKRIDHWRAHRAVLEATPEQATHLLALQDDVLPQPEYATRIATTVGRHPETVILAFVPGFPRERRMQMLAHAAHKDIAPFIIGAYVPTVAIVYPRAVIDAMLAWADTSGRDRYRRPLHGADDGIVANYCRLRRLGPIQMVPCAFEHDDTLASVGRGQRRGTHRRAALLG